MIVSRVVVTKVPSKPFDEEVYEAVRKCIDALGGAKTFASPGDKVLIKPNICAFNFSMTTDRRVYYSLALIFRDVGCDVTIGENPVINTPSKELFASDEMKRVAEKAGVKVVNFRAHEFVKVEVPNPKVFREIEVSKFIVDSDVIINVPTMRKHALAGLTLSLKNLYGFVSLEQRHIMHSYSLYWGLVEIAKTFKDKIKLTVMDGIYASLNGLMVPIGLIMASNDMIAVDTLTSYVLGWDPTKLETIKYAGQIGLGVNNLNEIEIEGVSLEELEKIRNTVAKHFNPSWSDPREVAKRLGKVEIVYGDPCPTCERNVTTILSGYSPKDFENAPSLAIVLGPGAKPVKGKVNIIVGDCLKKYAGEGIFVPCCPVYLYDLKRAIDYAIGKTTERVYLWEKLLPLIEQWI